MTPEITSRFDTNREKRKVSLEHQDDSTDICLKELSDEEANLFREDIDTHNIVVNIPNMAYGEGYIISNTQNASSLQNDNSAYIINPQQRQEMVKAASAIDQKTRKAMARQLELHLAILRGSRSDFFK